MNQKIEEAVKNLRSLLQQECNPHCTDVTIFVNSEGYKITQNLRSPGSLKRDGLGMRNLKGDSIELSKIQSSDGLDWNKYSENPPNLTIGTIILKLKSDSHGWVCRWLDASVALEKYGELILSSSE